jgi:hypothetical protein
LVGRDDTARLAVEVDAHSTRTQSLLLPVRALRLDDGVGVGFLTQPAARKAARQRISEPAWTVSHPANFFR